MDVDEAIEVVDQMDVKNFDLAKKEAATRQQSADAFRSEYRLRAEAIAAKSAKKKKGVAAVLIPHHCTQPEAKRLLPPGASIWRSLKRSEWCGHYPPYRRVTEPFTRSGSSQNALKACLRLLWRQYLDKFGKPDSECFVDGLFSESSGA